MSLKDQFNALPGDVRSRILDKHRDINANHDWWDSTYDSFKEQMEAVGIDVDQMYFSGFWSQGDGACFEGVVKDWTKFLGSLGYEDEVLIQHAHDHWTFGSKHSGHYYHEHCTAFTCELPLPESDEDQDFADDYLTCEKGSVEEAVRLVVLNTYDHNTMEEAFIEAFRGHMRDLYKQLEEDHDYLTSDTAVLEALEGCNLLEDEINEATETEGLYA